jgi:endonuclease/exonuclease/phosphatase family metal-dependent hydrolase
MSVRLSVLALLFVTACDARVFPVDAGQADAGPVDAGAAVDAGPSFRVLTFNVRRFFDPVCQSGQCAAGDFEALPTQADFEARADQLAAGIRATGADVVVLQEIENQACLDALSSRLSDILPGATMGETGAPGSMDVAVLARVAIARTVKHRGSILIRPDGSTTSFSREFYEVHVQLLEREVIAFAAHFRSKVNDDSGRRLAEAQAAHTIVTQAAAANPDAVVLLAGDLNDTPGSAPIDALEADAALIRVARENPVADQATYIFSGQGQAIDHVFRAARSPGITVPGSVKVLKGPGGYAGSDHFALQADFTVR